MISRKKKLVSEEVRRTIFLVIFLPFITCSLVFLSGCGGEEAQEKGRRALPVKVAEVVKGDIEEVINLTGNVKGRREVQIYAKVPGKLTKKIKDVGDRVKKNQVIALIDRDEEALKYSSAEVKSPISGEVTRYFVDLGESVFPAQPMPRSPVVMVADMDKVKVIVNVIERYISRVGVGQQAEIFVSAYPERSFVGEVKTVSKSLDPISRTAQVEILLDNPEHLLRPGMFARVKLITKGLDDVLIMPRSALIEREDKSVVFAVEEGKAKERIVELGATNDTKIQIIAGVEEGRKVIVEGNYGLLDGTKVEVVDGGKSK